MKEVGTALQTAYFTALTGIVVDGKSVPVYDVVPASAVYPHIKIGSKTGVDDPDKTSFGDNVTQEVIVIDRYPANTGGKSRMYKVSNEVKTRIRVRNRLSLSGFNMITSTLDNDLTVEELTDTYQYYRNSIRFRHIIQQT